MFLSHFSVVKKVVQSFIHCLGHFTMCDFLDFGLTFFSIMCIQVIAQLPQRLNSTFLFFFSLLWHLWSRSTRKKFKKR